MLDWLRPLWLIFYSPVRGMGAARDRGRLLPAALLALLAQIGFVFYTQWPYLSSLFPRRGTFALLAVLVQSASSMISVALIFVPAAILISNLFERRGSLRLVLQQEYAAVASTIFYAVTASNIAALPLAFLLKASGWLSALSHWYVAYVINSQREQPELARFIDPQLLNPVVISALMLQALTLPLLAVLTIVAARVVFRLSWSRAIILVIVSSIIMLIGALVLSTAFGALIASPIMIVLIFFLLRGYAGEITRTHRARLAFKQNLEAATLNPADASAHYNLGLIHQQRNELGEARKRFERAVEIDTEELDAHYQLGRIARAENRLGDAIKHFEPVVEQNPLHAQHEIWREIGSTYLAAGQYEDALHALERFTDHRQLDPEGLYLQGRAHAGLGHTREAAASMQACIEAVKTAPAYKYRTEKHWLNEAQEFIKSSQ